jgi:23S rRNA-/tRNA-specific pseudouridylate synthase
MSSIQPVIERQFSKRMVMRRDILPVYVQTEVLGRGMNNTALLEIQTSTVKWNFLRVYCADMLVPILGDHLFSCRVQNILGVPTKIDPTHMPPGSSDQVILQQQYNQNQQFLSSNPILCIHNNYCPSIPFRIYLCPFWKLWI